MKTIICSLIFLFTTSICYAGFNICDNQGSLSKQGSSPIDGCLYFNDDDMTEYTRVKNLYGSTRQDFLKIENGIVVEKSQAEKDIVLQVEADAQAQAEINRIDNLDISLKELIGVLEKKGIISKTEIITELKK